MKLKKQINNTHVLATNIEKTFGFWPNMSTKENEVMILEIPENIDTGELTKFVTDWSDIRTDDELIEEQQEEIEEQRILKVLGKAIKKEAKTSLLTAEASTKIDIIEGKKANGKSSGNVDSN